MAVAVLRRAKSIQANVSSNSLLINNGLMNQLPALGCGSSGVDKPVIRQLLSEGKNRNKL